MTRSPRSSEPTSGRRCLVGSSAQPGSTDLSKRAAGRIANRNAIMAAAAELAALRGVCGVTSGELAQVAGVSRRTVFNHFPTVQDAVLAALSRDIAKESDDWIEMVAGADRHFATLGEVIDAFIAGVPRIPFTSSLQIMGDIVKRDPAAIRVGLAWRFSVLNTATRQLAQAVCARLEDPDPLAVEILTKNTMVAWSVSFEHWVRLTNAGADDAEQTLLRRMIISSLSQVRAGYTS